MELSLFLAKLLGLYYLIVAVIMLLHKVQFRSIMSEITSSRGLIGITGIMSLIAGLAIAISHSLWVSDWRVAITVIGYLAIVQGIVRLGFPEFVQKMGRKMMSKGYWVIFGVLVVLGAFLAYHGFHLVNYVA